MESNLPQPPFSLIYLYTPSKDPTLHEEDLIELGVPIRLHRRRLLALVADFGRNGVPREALLSRPPGSSPKEDAATPDEPLPGPAEDAAGAEAAEQVAAAADPIQQELWAAARLELLAVEEEQELG